MATVAGEVFKEFHALARNVDKLSDGQAQVELEDESEKLSDDLMTFLLHVCPNAGHYKGASINFRIRVPYGHPYDAPSVECLNSVYHPNIDIADLSENRSICVNLLGEDWQPEVGLDGCVIAILFLFHHPNPEDALSHAFSGSEMDEEEFAANVRASLKGEEVEGICFDRLLLEDFSTGEKCENVQESVGDATSAAASAESEPGETTESVPDLQGEALLPPTDVDGARDEEIAVPVAVGDELVHSEIPENNATDFITSTAELPAPTSDLSDLVDRSEERNALDKETTGEGTVDLPQAADKFLLQETRPCDLHSYNWRHIAFSVCKLFKRMYNGLRKNHRTKI